MADAVKINKKMEMNAFELVKFQMITHCFISNIHLNETEFNILALLGTKGEIRLIDFCRLAAEEGYLGNTTAVNNCLSRIEKSKLFIKKGTGKKIIYLNPELNIRSQGTILLNYLVIKRGEPEKIAG